MTQDAGRVRIAIAADGDRDAIYRMRHAVYASELGQHPENAAGQLRDALDSFNEYIVASLDGKVAGFVSVTPPGQASYSIDKYLPRRDLPFGCDHGLYEVRILTVRAPHRSRLIAGLLMYAALRWVESRGGTRIVAIGRREVLDLYLKVGLRPLGRQFQSGAVTFELMSATTAELREGLARFASVLRRFEAATDWQLDLPFSPGSACYHGGAFFDAIGVGFETLERREQVINADVLDAWFPPAPGVVAALAEHLPWLLKTSPPTGCEGLIQTIARTRGVDPDCVVPGAGSSSLLFLALRQWLAPSSRVLLLDPCYGEYAHVLERVVGCRVDRFPLARREGYQVDLERLAARFDAGYDLIVLVNPNNPTGRHVTRDALLTLLAHAPACTRIWVDEAYSEYAGPDQSIERWVSRSANTVVCKSMSKVYALSGARVAYLCAPLQLARELRALTPPWAVSLPAQVAGVMALRDPSYYEERYRQTRALRSQLAQGLRVSTGMETVPGEANFVLCHLPPDGPDAATVCARCRAQNLFVRDTAGVSSRLGRHSLRVAVKDEPTNRRIVEILQQATVVANSR